MHLYVSVSVCILLVNSVYCLCYYMRVKKLFFCVIIVCTEEHFCFLASKLHLASNLNIYGDEVLDFQGGFSMKF